MKPPYFSLNIRLLFSDLFRIRIRIRIRNRIPNVYFGSGSDPAKSFGFLRIRIRNTGCIYRKYWLICIFVFQPFLYRYMPYFTVFFCNFSFSLILKIWCLQIFFLFLSPSLLSWSARTVPFPMEILYIQRISLQASLSETSSFSLVLTKCGWGPDFVVRKPVVSVIALNGNIMAGKSTLGRPIINMENTRKAPIKHFHNSFVISVADPDP